MHIVCLDVPFPPDYGGVFDLFYKIRELAREGHKIHLHCFEYGRGEQPELEKYCVEVTYYRRKRFFSTKELTLPYIVGSRINPYLIENLSKDDFPVLLEGIHCTYYLYSGQLDGRKVLVRLHNVEYQYYRQLSKFATSVYKRVYYRLESRLLRKYEKTIAKRAKIVTVSRKDQEIYESKLGATDIEFLPVFLPFDTVQSQVGKGSFSLYHGNLSVAENEKAVLWLLEHVFAGLGVPFVVAGKNPSPYLRTRLEKSGNVQLIADPSQSQMEQLVREAHIHVLPSFNATGIKIKLLHALFTGRFVVANEAAVSGTGLRTLCFVAENECGFREKIAELADISFDENEVVKRRELLGVLYNNERNARRLMSWL